MFLIFLTEEIQDNRKFNQREEEIKIDEVTGMQTPQEEVHTTSPTPTFVKSHTDITQEQQAFHFKESNVIATAKQSCIPEFAHDRNPTAVQEIEVFEIKHNVNRVMENLDKEETEIIENEKTDTTQLNEESDQQDKQLEADITDKSNTKVQTPGYLTDENVEINITDYAEEKNQNPTHHAKEKEGIEDIFKQEEKEKLIEQTTNTQSEEEEVQTHAPAFVIGDTNQTPHQETMHADESKVMDNAKQSCIPEIELDGKPIVFQETEVSENVKSVIENLDKEETEIRENEKTDTTQLNEESGEQDKQLEADITDKSNKKVQTPEYVTDENVEINITDYAEEKNQNPTDHAKEKEGIEDIFKQEEKEKLIEQTTNTQSEEEEVQTHGPAFVIGDTNQIPHQETMHADESKVMDNAKQSYIPEIELDGKPIVFQETEVSENVKSVIENLDKEETEIRENEKTDTTQLNEESGEQDKQLEADITDKSNKKVQTPEYVTDENVEINITDYAEEKNQNPTDHAKEKEGIEDIFKQEEKEKLIEQTTNTQSEEEEVQTHGPAFVIGDTNQIPHQETMHGDESKVIDNAKQSYIPEIELDGKPIVFQETEVSENVKSVIENLDKEETEIRENEKTDTTQLNEESGEQDKQLEADITDKSNEKVQTPEYVTDENVEINITDYAEEKNQNPTDHAKEKEGIEDIFKQEEKEKLIEQTTNTQSEEEEVQTHGPAFVIGDTNQIPHQETMHNDESKVIDNAKQSYITEIQLDGKAIVFQETEVSENVKSVIENLDKEETEIKENEKTDTTQLNEESGEQDKQLEADITDKSNEKEQTPEYVTDENVEINITYYAEEKNQNPTHHAKEKEGIEDIFKQAEKEKLIEQTTNTQSEEEEVQTHGPAFVIDDTNQIPHQETMHNDESKVMDNAKQSYIPEIQLDGKAIVFQETEVSENVKSVIENLAKEETEIRENEKTDTTQLNEESGEQDKQLEADITDKSNKKVQTPEYVTDENVEINITDYAEEKNQNPTDHAKEKEGIEDIFKQEEKEKLVEQTTNTQSEEEEVQTHGPAFVIGDTNQIPHQETMHGDESKVIDNTKQISIPEIELDGKASVFQETEVSENVNRVIENLDKEETEIRENEKTDTTQLNDESGEQDKQLEADITDKSNKKVQTPEYVTDENVEINITDYAEEKNQNPTHHAKEKEGIEDIFKQAEKEKLIEETTNTQSEEEEVQTHGPASVIGDTNQIPYLETMHADESKVMDNAKQSYIPEIELDGKAVVFQETEVSESLYKKDATEIRVKKEIDAKKLTDSEMPKPKIEEDGALKPIANAELVRTEAVEESGKQETQQKKDITEETADESNKEVLIKKFAITEKTAEINTNNCTKEHDTVETSPAKEQEGTGDGAKLHEEKANGIEEKTKTQNPEEEFQTSSPTPAFVQGDSGQTLQQETVKIDESEVLDNDKHRSIPEIELDGKSTVVQETNNPEIKDNISTGAEDLDNKDAIEVQAEEGAYVKQLTNVEIPNSEIKDTEVPEDEVPQPIEVAAAIETVDDINQKEIKIEEDITEKKSNKDEQSSQYVATDTTEIKTNSYTDEHDKVQTSHAEVNQGTEGDENFGQVEEAKGNEETNKVQLPEEEVQIRSPTPAFVQGDTDQISQQELLLVDEPEVIDYVEQSCIPEIELDRKSTVVQETEKPETKNNVSIVTENLGTNDASEIIAKEETDAEKLADVKIVKSEIKGVPKDETLKPTANAVLLRTEAVEKNSQQDKQQEAEVSDKSIKEVQSQEYITEGSAEININNEAEEKDKNSTSNAEKKEGTSHAEEKEGIEDIFNQKEKEKEIEEATKTHSVEEEEIQRRSPPPGFVQGDTNQILHQETLHINESEVIHNAKLSYIPEIELHEKAIVVQKSEKVETKDNFDRVRENLNKDESENRAEEGIDVNQLTDLEMPKSETKGVLEDDSLQPMPDTVSVEKEAVSVSQEKRQPQEEFIKKVNKEVQTPQYFTEDREKIETTNDTEEQEEVPTSQPKEKSGNKDDDKFEQEEEKIGIEESTKTQLQDKDISTTIGEPEDKALITRLNSSSNGNEGLDEISPEKFTENLNKDVQTPQRNTKANTETNITSYPDKLEEAEDIEESIEKQLAEEEIQHTLPTPTSVQEDIDQMSQQQTLHDDEIEVISNAKSCMTEIELDRKSIVVEESKQPETKANDDLVKEEQADHQSKESRDQSFITNYIIVERHTTSESNKELSDDVDLDGQKKLESHLEEFLEIKDASEIRAKGIHSKQLTDVEIKKSETEGVAEDKGMQTMSSTSVKNYAINECCQEEIQPREEYAETHIKEVKMPHYEFNMQKHIPEVYGVEEDTCQTRVVNEQKLESQLASLNKEATFIDNRYSDGEIENANAISDIEKEVNPKSHTKQKLVIHDSIFNEEEAKGIEEMTKIKLLNSATDCPPEEEVQPKLPDPATVQGDTDQILQQQTLPSDALDTIDNNLRSIPENELDRMSTSVEEPETKANINIVEEKSDKQSHEPSMQSLITDYITAEGHLASENSSKLSYDKKEQKTVNLQMVENLGIMYASKTTTEEVTDAKQPTGVELEKTKNEELIENKTLDESNQEEMQPEEDFSETYTKGKKTPQSSMENVNSEGMEITENSSKSSYAEEEQEQVINTYTIENSEIKDSRIIKLEEASDIKEATDESVDKAISFLSTIPSVRIGIVDESIQEKIQKDVQPAVINSKAEQRPENDFVRNMEVLEGPGNTSVENDEKVEVQSEANNQKTIKKHPNLEELETAEISPSSDTKELGKEREVAKLGGVSESVSVDITEHIDTGKLETQEAETGTSGNTKEGEEFEKISPSSSVGVISRDSQDSGTKVLHKKSHGILSGVGSKVKHSISKVKKVITGKSSHPKTPPS
ncbi:uncharacterized protein LOC108327682 isoform X2 [Vigna angularis]|uniref:uncharacterized protein LOC108327682 isoform X2 n=1 Tax=Phaseolus angularis TaxID=3914 RepID=UPI0022B5E204|nr:uncharacterized protein LOC108327682 isoform X2 [Vigna angularis]